MDPEELGGEDGVGAVDEDGVESVAEHDPGVCVGPGRVHDGSCDMGKLGFWCRVDSGAWEERCVAAYRISIADEECEVSW